MVSRFGHCLNDLLFRQATGNLNIEVPAIGSNHRDLEPLARAEHSLAPDDLVSVGRDIEAVVLARALRLHVERRVRSTSSR